MAPKIEAAAIEKDILDYLGENPGAQDTLQGIIQWWVMERRLIQAIADVETALDHLVAKKLVTKHSGWDGSVYYGIGEKRASNPNN